MYQNYGGCSIDSEESILVSSKSNGHFTKNTVKSDRASFHNPIQCTTVKLEKEEGNHIAVGLLTAHLNIKY